MGNEIIVDPPKYYEKFDPEGDGYDHKTADELIKLYPLTIPKPKEYQGDEVYNEGAFQAWVWHEDLGEYKIHGSSRDPRTGMMLKGMKHQTMKDAIAADEALGYILQKGEDGRYYSVPAADAP